MRKKHDKIVLKSEVFKTKTPEKINTAASRSPISRSPYLSKKDEEKMDPNDLFQKVCCPNCRFIFKIIRNPDGLLTAHSRRKDKQVISQLTQTQEIILRESIEIKNLSVELSRRLSPDNDQPSKGNYLKSQMYQIMEDPSESGREETLKINDLSAIGSNSKLAPNKSSLRSSIKMGEKPSEQSSFLEHIKQERQEGKTKEELKEILSQLYMGSKVNEALVALFKELPLSLQVPAYHKMLLDSETKSELKT